MKGETLQNMWILNTEVHIDEMGVQVPLQDSDYVWQPIGGPCIGTCYSGGKSTKVDIKSSVILPLESKQSLHSLVLNMKTVLKHNFIPGTNIFTLNFA